MKKIDGAEEFKDLADTFFNLAKENYQDTETRQKLVWKGFEFRAYQNDLEQGKVTNKYIKVINEVHKEK